MVVGNTVAVAPASCHADGRRSRRLALTQCLTRVAGGAASAPAARAVARRRCHRCRSTSTPRADRVIVDAVRATGRIEAVQAVELRPDEQGRVTALLFQEGQFVAAGTPLVRIDDAMLQAQAERAKADRDLARQQLERVRRLREQNACVARRSRARGSRRAQRGGGAGDAGAPDRADHGARAVCGRRRPALRERGRLRHDRARGCSRCRRSIRSAR